LEITDAEDKCIVVLSTLYPNKERPQFGIFVFRKAQALKKIVKLKVYALVPWFPGAHFLSRYSHRRSIPRNDKTFIVDSYLRFFSVPKFFKYLDGIFLFFTLAKSISKKNTALLSAELAYPEGLAATLLGKILNIPVCITVRGHEVNTLLDMPSRKSLVMWALEHADAVTCVADALQERIRTHQIKCKKLLTITNGIDRQIFTYREQKLVREKLHLSLSKKIVLSVGHLIERKGHHLVVKAIETLDVHLFIVGSGSEEGDYSKILREYIAKLNLQDKVTFIPEVSQEELSFWYNAADIFVLASDKEGRPNVLAEALCCGAPAVATNVWGNKEILNDSKFGILCERTFKDIAEALSCALETIWDRKSIAQNTHIRSWEDTAQEYANLYYEIIASNK
jgi:teichuronic acid biosynthesis glycosyltransferase TuaC